MMDVKISKDKHISIWVGWENFIYVIDEITSNTVHKDREGINWWKRGKTLNEVKTVKNISKNLKMILEINPVQKEALLDVNSKTIHISNWLLSD